MILCSSQNIIHNSLPLRCADVRLTRHTGIINFDHIDAGVQQSNFTHSHVSTNRNKQFNKANESDLSCLKNLTINRPSNRICICYFHIKLRLRFIVKLCTD